MTNRQEHGMTEGNNMKHTACPAFKIRCLPTHWLLRILMDESASKREKIVSDDELKGRLSPEDVERLRLDIVEDLRMQNESEDYKPKRFANVYKNPNLMSNMVKVTIPQQDRHYND